MTPAPRWLVWTHDRDIDGAPAYLLFAPADPRAVQDRRRLTIAAGAGLSIIAAGVTTALLGLAAGLTIGVVLAAGAAVLTTDSTYGRSTVRTDWNPLLADLDLARRRAPHLLAELHPLAWGALSDQHPAAAGTAPAADAAFERQMALRGVRLRLHAEVGRQGDGVVDDLMRTA